MLVQLISVEEINLVKDGHVTHISLRGNYEIEV
jgi:hypothetical protein